MRHSSSSSSRQTKWPDSGSMSMENVIGSSQGPSPRLFLPRTRCWWLMLSVNVPLTCLESGVRTNGMSARSNHTLTTRDEGRLPFISRAAALLSCLPGIPLQPGLRRHFENLPLQVPVPALLVFKGLLRPGRISPPAEVIRLAAGAPVPRRSLTPVRTTAPGRCSTGRSRDRPRRSPLSNSPGSGSRVRRRDPWGPAATACRSHRNPFHPRSRTRRTTTCRSIVFLHLARAHAPDLDPLAPGVAFQFPQPVVEEHPAVPGGQGGGRVPRQPDRDEAVVEVTVLPGLQVLRRFGRVRPAGRLPLVRHFHVEGKGVVPHQVMDGGGVVAACGAGVGHPHTLLSASACFRPDPPTPAPPSGCCRPRSP